MCGFGGFGGFRRVKMAPKPKSEPSKVAMRVVASPSSHPPYWAMIKAAIKADDVTGGTSRQAIANYIVERYSIEKTKVTAPLRRALLAGLADGSIKQTKGTGAAGSFKIAEAVNAKKAVGVKVAHPKTAAVVKSKSVSSKVVASSSSHRSYSDMIKAAIKADVFGARGTSRQAIANYIVESYSIEKTKVTAPLRRALLAGLADGSLKQTKGTGASGSFKIAEAVNAKKAVGVKVAHPKKATSVVKTVTVAKLPKTPKKMSAKAASKPKKVTAAKSPKMATHPRPPMRLPRVMRC